MLAVALLCQVIASDPGLVIVRFRGYDISTSVPVAGLFLLLAGIAVWLLVALIRIPFRVWTRYRQRRARARLSDGLIALHEGRWLRAQKLLEKAADENRVRSEEHTSELQSLMRISYAVFCLKKKKYQSHINQLEKTKV